jgi:hypothetical protein
MVNKSSRSSQSGEFVITTIDIILTPSENKKLQELIELSKANEVKLDAGVIVSTMLTLYLDAELERRREAVKVSPVGDIVTGQNVQ